MISPVNETMVLVTFCSDFKLKICRHQDDGEPGKYFTHTKILVVTAGTMADGLLDHNQQLTLAQKLKKEIKKILGFWLPVRIR